MDVLHALHLCSLRSKVLFRFRAYQQNRQVSMLGPVCIGVDAVTSGSMFDTTH